MEERRAFKASANNFGIQMFVLTVKITIVVIALFVASKLFIGLYSSMHKYGEIIEGIIGLFLFASLFAIPPFILIVVLGFCANPEHAEAVERVLKKFFKR